MAVNLTLIQTLLQQIPRDEIENAIKNKLQSGAAKLDLISREEFEIQAQILAKACERLDKLEALINELCQQNQLDNS